MCNQKTSWSMYLSITGSGLRCWGSWTSSYSPHLHAEHAHSADRRRAEVRKSSRWKLTRKLPPGTPVRDANPDSHNRSRLVARLLLLSDPVVDGFDVEAPVAANAKRRNLILPQEPVNRGRMHVQIGCHFTHGHDFFRPRILRCPLHIIIVPPARPSLNPPFKF